MPLAEDFAAAQARVKKLARPPSNDELLELYSLYKQASSGDVAPRTNEAAKSAVGRVGE